MRQVLWAMTSALWLVALGPRAIAESPEPTGNFARGLVAAALSQTQTTVTYDGSYRRISYPGGDVPETTGVCSDVVIRAYRKVGIDLQVRVHEDMTRAFAAYPQSWGLPGPDPNIDHRRVPNLQAYLRRCGAELAPSREASDYRPADLVTWMLPGHLPHIGIVAEPAAGRSTGPTIVHNIGRGPRAEAMLFDYPITGHYRLLGECGPIRGPGREAPTDPERRREAGGRNR